MPCRSALALTVLATVGCSTPEPEPTFAQREDMASQLRGGSGLSGLLLDIARRYREIYVPATDFDDDGLADFAVGASNGATEEVSVFYGDPAGIASVPDQTIASPLPGTFAAFQTSTNAGDVNGDGYDDLLVGANNVAGGGAAYLYLGGPLGLSSTPDQTLLGSGTGLAGTLAFGFRVASALDLDRDGYDDVAISAVATSVVNLQDGAVFIYRGGPNGLSVTPDFTLLGSGGALDNFGRSIAATYVNGDIWPDLVISETRSPFFGGSSEGRVLVFLGGPTFDTVVDQVVTGPSGPGQGFGLSLAPAADVNLDGYGDFIVGESLVDNFTGRAWLYLGSSSGVEPVPALELRPPTGNMGGFFGFVVTAAGDVDRNGLPELVVGETDANGLAGETHLFFNRLSTRPTPGSTAVVQPDQTLSVAFPDPIGFFGQDLGFVGDIDGNRADELLVGAPGLNNFTGALFAFEGTTPGSIPATPIARIDGTVPGGSFGIEISD